MKIVLMGNYPRDKTKIIGGTSSVAWRLAEAVSALPDMEVHVITCVDGCNSAVHTTCGRVYEHYLPSQRLGCTTFYAVDRLRISRLLKEIGPDIIHVHGSQRYPPCVWRSGYPWILTPHGLKATEAKLYPGLKTRLRVPLQVKYEKWAYKVARDIIVLSEYVMPFVKPFTKACLREIPNPVSDDYFKISTNEVPGSILFVGAVIERKGLIYLLQAMDLLKQRKCKCKLNLVGKPVDEDYTGRLRSYVDENGLQDYVDMMGIVEEDRLQELYGECSMLVLPSLEETQPVCIMQAMAAGKPVVGANAGGIPYLIRDGITGFIAEARDPAALADKIEALLADPELRASMGKSAREEAETKYSSEGVARAHVAAYQSVIDTWRS
ncbi:MAG: glycosyltransferase family 4 protein [Armatimonadota bacterium]